ncbi:uroporphyrinogen decarboxylase [Wolbachia endosymbiont of Pentidionis agamae]|uniref:uroporphyrinogen decarboxylase n=1 Tax=Wolbachia endosymbiont of Pentidionis agamae TaxID=3110435 RepID=UPI002FD4B73B
MSNESTQNLVRTINKLKTKKVPIWLMRQAGRYLPEYHSVKRKSDSFMSLCYNQESVIELTLQPIKRFNIDAAIIFSDILVVPDALGCNVSFLHGVGPKITPISSYKELEDLNIISTKLMPIFLSIKKIREQLHYEKSLIGFAGGPWTVASYMIEGATSTKFSRIKKMCYSDPSTLDKIIDIITEATILYLTKQIEYGIDLIQIFDSHSGVLSDFLFNKYVIEPTKKIVSTIHKNFPNFPIIGFPKSSGVLYKEYCSKTNISAVSIDYSVPLEWIKDNITIPIQGNLDPYLLAYDKNKALKDSKKILDFFKGTPFIFNLGHGIIPDTPLENVYELVDLVNNYN